MRVGHYRDCQVKFRAGATRVPQPKVSLRFVRHLKLGLGLALVALSLFKLGLPGRVQIEALVIPRLVLFEASRS